MTEIFFFLLFHVSIFVEIFRYFLKAAKKDFSPIRLCNESRARKKKKNRLIIVGKLD